jgi:SOS response associated peptidase (SRAP)
MTLMKLRHYPQRGGEEILSTAIIVGEANPLVEGIHDRMPVMLMSEDYDRWLAPTTSVRDLKALLKPYDPALMEAYAVSRAVNSVKNDTELSHGKAKVQSARSKECHPPMPTHCYRVRVLITVFSRGPDCLLGLLRCKALRCLSHGSP